MLWFGADAQFCKERLGLDPGLVSLRGALLRTRIASPLQAATNVRMSDWRANLSKVKRMGVAKLSNMRKGESVDEAFAAKKARVIEVEKKVKELLMCMNTFASKALEMTGASTTVASRSARLTDAPPSEAAATASDAPAADPAGINPVMAGAVEAGRLMQASAEELSASVVSITTTLN